MITAGQVMRGVARYDGVGAASRKLAVPRIIDATRAPERREVR
jgi:hypothetical protein